MSVLSSQITDSSAIWSKAYSGQQQRNHQSAALPSFCKWNAKVPDGFIQKYPVMCLHANFYAAVEWIPRSLQSIGTIILELTK